MYIKQLLLNNINKFLQPNKVIVIFGARRCGKTTLINEYLKENKEDYMLLNGEDINIRKVFSSESINELQNYIGNKKLFA